MISVLYENRQIIAAEKPVGIPCQPDMTGDGDFMTLLSQQCGTSLFPVHRLDRNTGGVMVFAKTKKSAAALSELFAMHLCRKEYLAVTEGVPDAPMGSYRDYLYHDKKIGKSFPTTPGRRDAKEAVLSYTLLDRAQDERGEYALLRVRLETGRTHQIRAQFAAHGTPLCGDGKYGGRDNRVKGEKTPLWACRLVLPACPLWNGDLILTSSAPMDAEPWSRFSTESVEN